MEQLERLNRPDRSQLMPIGPVLEAVDARAGSVVADVGAGLGWLTFPLAVAVGSIGRVYAVDPSRDGIGVIESRAKSEGLGQIRAVVAPAEATGLSADSVDRIVWHTMYHDVGDRQAALQEMARILKPGGLWVIVDWDKRPMDMGPPLSVRMSPDDVWGEVQTEGFIEKRRFSPGPVTWGLTVEKPR